MDVSRFKIEDEIIDIKDRIARERISQLDTGLNKKIDNLEMSTNNKITALETSTNNKIAAINKRNSYVVNVVADFGADNSGNSDSTEALTNAFKSGADIIFFPAGTYNTSQSIKINSNTYVLGTQASIWNRKSNNIFINNSKEQGNYSANHNITIEGLTLLGSANPQTLLAFSHCSNIRIINCEFGSYIDTNQNWHLVEINGCKNVWIDKCYFTGTIPFNSEMLQLDVPTSSEVFPWFGPYDNTPCVDVNITNCIFYHPEKYNYETLTSTDAGIGNHNGSDSAPISRVTIKGCSFLNVKNAFKFQYLSNSVISNNIAENAMSGFAYVSNQQINTTIITNNIFKGNAGDYKDSISNTALGRGISISTQNGQSCAFNTISDNSVSGFASHGIAINGYNSIISGNQISACGYHGLFCDYDQFKCNTFNNNSYNNGKISEESSDIYISHTKHDAVQYHGNNNIYSNTCGNMKAVSYTNYETNKSNIHDNIFSSIDYPTSFKTLNFYGNSKFDSNPNLFHSSGSTSTEVSGWTETTRVSVDHKAYYNIDLNVVSNTPYSGCFVVRLRNSNNNVSYGFQICESTKQTAANVGISISCTKLVDKADILIAEVYIINKNDSNTLTSILTATEVPIAY